jgi:hypothetical protein
MVQSFGSLVFVLLQNLILSKNQFDDILALGLECVCCENCSIAKYSPLDASVMYSNQPNTLFAALSRDASLKFIPAETSRLSLSPPKTEVLGWPRPIYSNMTLSRFIMVSALSNLKHLRLVGISLEKTFLEILTWVKLDWLMVARCSFIDHPLKFELHSVIVPKENWPLGVLRPFFVAETI